jgi:uncharacterized protein (TIGR03083 family)
MTSTSTNTTSAALFSALQASNDRLNDLLTTIPAEDVIRPAYPTDWSVAQVASHLGSQAETFLLTLDAGVHGTPAPGVEQFQPIWDRWNAKDPADQVSDSVTADQAFLDAVDALTDGQRQTWRLPMMGTEQDLSGLLRMRLLEHLLHTWDIEVALDTTATLPGHAAALVIEQLPLIVRYTAKPTTTQQISVQTVEPELWLQLSLDPDGSQLETIAGPHSDAGQMSEQTLQLPTEAFVRLIYGRLDADHTPPTVEAEPALLDTLRAALPGA